MPAYTYVSSSFAESVSKTGLVEVQFHYKTDSVVKHMYVVMNYYDLSILTFASICNMLHTAPHLVAFIRLRNIVTAQGITDGGPLVISNPYTVEKTVAEIEKELKLVPGSLRIKKES